MFREADMRVQGPQIHQFNNVAPKLYSSLRV